MSLVILLGGVILLFILITLVKLNAFISLILSALFVGIANSMALPALVTAIGTGIGTTLGSLVLVLAFGVMLGSLLTETGAAQRISEILVLIFGEKRVKLALVLTGFTVGIALFYNAGFIVLIPLVFSIAATVKQPLVYLTVAMASALSVTHGFLPPHPGPTAIAYMFMADIGKTLLYGFIVAIPSIILAGLVFPEWIRKIRAVPPPGMYESAAPKNLPSFGISLFVALLPVLLMAIAAISEISVGNAGKVHPVIRFIGDPGMAMLIAVLVAIVMLGVIRGIRIKTLMDKTTASLNSITSILLVTAAGGAFKQVLIDTGTGASIADYFKDTQLSPLLLGWSIATAMRIAIGSATVAGLTAAGIVAPLIPAMGVQPELMVISIGAGSLMCSHVNDTGFWMFKEYMGLSLKDTFRTWTVMETIIGLTGLAGVLILDLFV